MMLTLCCSWLTSKTCIRVKPQFVDFVYRLASKFIGKTGLEKLLRRRHIIMYGGYLICYGEVHLTYIAGKKVLCYIPICWSTRVA